jgi:hypothetical protein
MHAIIERTLKNKNSNPQNTEDLNTINEMKGVQYV